MEDERLYVRLGWHDPSLTSEDPEPALADRVLNEWRRDRRRVRLVWADGGSIDAQLLALDANALYVAGADGRARLVFRQGLREIVVLDPGETE
jgi:hypothetical protein